LAWSGAPGAIFRARNPLPRKENVNEYQRSPGNPFDPGSPGDFDEGKPGYVFKEPPQSYWNLSAALFAYVYARLAQQGIDVVAESQIVGFPTQFPSVTMVDWNSGQPNVRYWVLKLIHDNFAPGDKLVETASTIPYVFAQGFVTHDGKRKLLLVNKRDRSFELFIPGSSRAEISYVDKTTGLQPPAMGQLTYDRTTLRGLAVAVVTFPN
jgi:hypothetical protein